MKNNKYNYEIDIDLYVLLFQFWRIVIQIIVHKCWAKCYFWGEYQNNYKTFYLKWFKSFVNRRQVLSSKQISIYGLTNFTFFSEKFYLNQSYYSYYPSFRWKPFVFTNYMSFKIIIIQTKCLFILLLNMEIKCKNIYNKSVSNSVIVCKFLQLCNYRSDI